MTNSIYKINKGINKPIEFKGLKAQYIWYLGVMVVSLLIIFAVLYIAGVHTYVCLLFIVITGTIGYAWIFQLSNKYGEFGMMKKLARASIPRCIKSRNRKLFTTLKPADGKVHR